MWILIAVFRCFWGRERRWRQRDGTERETQVRVEGPLQVCAVPEPQHSYKSNFGLVFSQRVLIVLNSEGLFSWALSTVVFTVSEKKTLKQPRFLQQSFLPAFSRLAARLHDCAFSQNRRDLTWILQLWTNMQKALKGKCVCLTLHAIWFPIKITWNVTDADYFSSHFQTVWWKVRLHGLLRIAL